MTTTRTLTVEHFDALDPDQHAAVRRWAVDLLGDGIRDVVALRYTEPTELTPSLLEAQAITGVDPELGVTYAWRTVAMQLDPPPALTSWPQDEPNP